MNHCVMLILSFSGEHFRASYTGVKLQLAHIYLFLCLVWVKVESLSLNLGQHVIMLGKKQKKRQIKKFKCL